MKKGIMITSFILLLGALLFIIIFDQKKEKDHVLLTVNKTYSYTNDQKELKVTFFINDLNHPLLDIDAIDSTFIKSKDNNKLLELDVVRIEEVNSELFQNQMFYQINYCFKMPNLDFDFEIEDLYLKIVLINNDEYVFYLGEIMISIPFDEEMEFISLEGLKQTNFSRITEIEIEIENYFYIEFIGYSKLRPLIFELKNNKIKININNENKLLQDFPLFITYYYQGSTYNKMINYHVYVIDYEILKNSPGAINKYDINKI